MVRIPAPPTSPNADAYRMGNCFVLVENHGSETGWHLSISHPTRYPKWDEIREARYALLPDDVTMAMILPPKSQYVNIHSNCFHLFQISNEEVPLVRI